MELELLNKLYQQAKKLKCAIIYIDGQIAYGSTIDFSILNIMNIENPYNIKICVNMEAIKTMIDTECINKKALFIPYFYNNIVNKLSKIQNWVNNITPLIVNNIRELDDFNSFENYKSKDGVFFFRIQGYTLAIFKTLLNINKNDVVDLFIYDNGSPLYIADFCIKKNKKMTIHHYLQYLKV